MTSEDYKEWTTDEDEDIESLDVPIEYAITASPNDFNIKTLYDFIKSSIINIPGFQRNYVWDLKRASKLIESIIMGLPIPQIFLYEENKNEFLVIDGQQRLLTIYYFFKKRFPLKKRRYELRKIFENEGKIPDKIFADDSYFSNFNLKLSEYIEGRTNRLDGLNFDTLDELDKKTFELRTIRSVIVKQHEPKDNSSIYEIFYRLNTGGMNLRPQEIRTSLYKSKFYDVLYDINNDKRWRRLINHDQPDLHMKDIEILLRGFAMLLDGMNYRPSMVKFLNNFSEKSKKFKEDQIIYLFNLFKEFLKKTEKLPLSSLLTRTGKFNISVYEAVFRTICLKAYTKKNLELEEIDPEKIDILKSDDKFVEATEYQTTSKKNVLTRLRKAEEILLS
jgi:uncharacterized protein with ParB-like and HNH nuclease domain